MEYERYSEDTEKQEAIFLYFEKIVSCVKPFLIKEKSYPTLALSKVNDE